MNTVCNTINELGKERGQQTPVQCKTKSRPAVKAAAENSGKERGAIAVSRRRQLWIELESSYAYGLTPTTCSNERMVLEEAFAERSTCFDRSL